MDKISRKKLYRAERKSEGKIQRTLESRQVLYLTLKREETKGEPFALT